MPAPTGEYLTYEVDGNERRVLIKPNVLCDKNLQQISALLKEEQRNKSRERVELLRTLKELPAEAIKDSVKTVVQTGLDESKHEFDYSDIIQQLSNPNGKALRIILTNSSDADVDEMLDHHPNVIEVMATTMTAAMETIEAVEKNLESLGLTDPGQPKLKASTATS